MPEAAGAVSEEKKRIRDVIRSWPRLAELAAFAMARRDFENSDGGFGLQYLDDVEAQEHELGRVEIYGYWGPPNGYERQIPERFYLEVLGEYLEEKGLAEQAALVRARLG